MKIALASISPRRHQLLKRIFKSFEIISPRAREYHFKRWTPSKNAETNAFRKALAVSCRRSDALVIGADTIVVLNKHLLGKPKTLKEARRMLVRLSGRIHQVYTGVALLWRKRGISCVFHEVTRVKMKSLGVKQIEDYFRVLNPLDRAGAYAIQEGPRIVERIWGSYTNVVGFPIEKTKRELKKLMTASHA